MNPHNDVVSNPTTRTRQVFLIFGMMVAGKTATFGVAKTRALIEELRKIDDGLPFYVLRGFHPVGLVDILMSIGTGRYNLLANGLHHASTHIDVDRCTKEELLAVPGIGPKTAGYFLMYAHGDLSATAIDTHMKKFLRDCGVPLGNHDAMAEAFRTRALALDLTTAQLDNYVWRHFARGEDTGYDLIIDILKLKGMA